MAVDGVNLPALALVSSSVGSVALASATDRTDLVGALDTVAAVCTALGIIGGSLWWALGPRVRDYLRTQQAAARQVTGEKGQPGPLERLGEKLDEHLADSRRGLRLLDALTARLDELTTTVDTVVSVQADQQAEIDRLRHDVHNVDQRVSEYLADAAAELRLARAARLLASGQLYPQDPPGSPTGRTTP